MQDKGMADESRTRCPACSTVFRVTAMQLAAHGGQVRCGRCHMVFDARTTLVAPAASAAEDESFADGARRLAHEAATNDAADASANAPPGSNHPTSADAVTSSDQATSADAVTAS